MFTKEKNFFTLDTSGLSMSDAQSISNMCNQRARGIEGRLKEFNNYSKVLDMTTLPGADSSAQKLVKTKGVPIGTTDVIKSLLSKKAAYHALQSYLMEHLKLKERLIEQAEKERDLFIPPSMGELGFGPLRVLNQDPEYKQIDIKYPVEGKSRDEAIMSVLTANEIVEDLINTANAAHIGSFIHKEGLLTKLRDELPKLPEFEIMSFPDGRSAIVNIEVHNTADQLEQIHIDLADLHRTAERKVNAVKSKILTSTTKVDNDRVEDSQIRADAIKVVADRIRNENIEISAEYHSAISKLSSEHVVKYNNEISSIAKLKIVKHNAFIDVFNEFFKTTK